MARSRSSLRGSVAAGLAVLAARVLADCTCTGLDYTNGGSYLIDGTSSNNFIFTSQFSGGLE